MEEFWFGGLVISVNFFMQFYILKKDVQDKILKKDDPYITIVINVL